MLVDLSGTDHNGSNVQVMVNPDHITSMQDESGSYYRYTRITLVGGASVRVPWSLAQVRSKLAEASRQLAERQEDDKDRSQGDA